MDEFEQILKLAQEKISLTKNISELQKIRVEFFGKRGLITQEMKKLSDLNIEKKKSLGQIINNIKEQIQNLVEAKQVILEEELNKRFIQDQVDITIPARQHKKGSIHPITQASDELIQVFTKFGFTIQSGPTIESDWYNFTALNFYDNHPARQMHDTFYLKGKGDSNNPLLLRTHTSPIQIRAMQNSKPPFRFIAPGKTYRADSDMTHTPMFHQIEGLVVDKDINMAHLKYVIVEFIKDFFEHTHIELRFRPSFFPFTEPSAEVDIKMKNSEEWLEVLGCGMVHPNVLSNVNIDCNEYRGFAFGLGIERFAMLKYGIKDLRQFFESDLRWLKHYNFSAFDIPTLVGGLTR